MHIFNHYFMVHEHFLQKNVLLCRYEKFSKIVVQSKNTQVLNFMESILQQYKICVWFV